MNKSKKGSRQEKLALEELIEYVTKTGGYKLVAQWKVYRSRAGGNDLFGGWDVGIIANDTIANDTIGKLVIFLQVKSRYSSSEIKRLRPLAIGTYNYLAVYGREPHHFSIKLPHFWLVRVDRT